MSKRLAVVADWFSIAGGILALIGILLIIIPLTSWPHFLKVVAPYVSLAGILGVVAGRIFSSRRKLRIELEKCQSKVGEQTKIIEDLRSAVEGGLEFTYNESTVKVHRTSKFYEFKFEKHFKIISPVATDRYQTQFYCNRHPESLQETMEYYKDRTPQWKNLGPFANLQKIFDDNTRGEIIPLQVNPVSDHGYFIPFNVLFFRPNGNSMTRIQMPIDSHWILRYGYEVSADLWGSFLNRSLTYFGEQGLIRFECAHSQNESPGLKLFELSPPHFEPEEIRSPHLLEEGGHNHVYVVSLPRKSKGRFRLTWDSQNLFGIPNTPNVRDESRLTNF
jgi:hypothetical protein